MAAKRQRTVIGVCMSGDSSRNVTVAEVQRGRTFVGTRGCTPKGGPVNKRRRHPTEGTWGRLGPRASPSPRYLSCFSWPASPWPREGRPQRGLPQPRPERVQLPGTSGGGASAPRPAPRVVPGPPPSRPAVRSPRGLRGPSEMECDSLGAGWQTCGDQPSAWLPGGSLPFLGNAPVAGRGGSSERGSDAQTPRGPRGPRGWRRRRIAPGRRLPRRLPGMALQNIVTATAPTALELRFSSRCFE